MTCLGVTPGWSALGYDMPEHLSAVHDDRSTSGLPGQEIGPEEKIRVLALSKRNFDILLRSLAAVVGIDGVVGPDSAPLHGFRVLSDLAVLCSFLWHRVKNMVTRRERRGYSGCSLTRVLF